MEVIIAGKCISTKLAVYIYESETTCIFIPALFLVLETYGQKKKKAGKHARIHW